MQDKGAKCIIIPPALSVSSARKSIKNIEMVEKMLKEFDIPFVVNPKRYFMDDSYFYDTYYHLNYKGVLLRTNILIDDIKNIIQ